MTNPAAAGTAVAFAGAIRHPARDSSITLVDREPSRSCRHCREPITITATTGRWPRYCSHACRQAAYRARQNGSSS
jgi:hypothetical protein